MEEQKGYFTRVIDFVKSLYQKEAVPEEPALEPPVKITSPKLGPYREQVEVPPEEPRRVLVSSLIGQGSASVIPPYRFEYLLKPESERLLKNDNYLFTREKKVFLSI